MTSRRLVTLTLGTCLAFVMSAPLVRAQGTTGTKTATGTQGGLSSGTGLGSSGSSTSSTNQTLKMKATSSGAGSATGVPSASNAFAPSMGDPYSMGLSSKYTNGPPTSPTATFGKANYTSTAQGAGAGGGAATTTTATNYGTQPGVVRNPQYSTVLSDDIPLVVHKSEALFVEVRDVIARSSRLQNKKDINVSVNGNVVILTGKVGTDRERLVVEGIVKMTPGVREVQNQLQVVQMK